jgi:hypothetical protein
MPRNSGILPRVWSLTRWQPEHLLNPIAYIDGAGAQAHDPALILLRSDEVIE